MECQGGVVIKSEHNPIPMPPTWNSIERIDTSINNLNGMIKKAMGWGRN